MSKPLITAITLLLSTCTLGGCATTQGVKASTKRIPGQAPVSLASADVHDKWGGRPSTARIPSRRAYNQRDTLEPSPSSGPDNIREGFENIKRSTDQCLARSMKRDGKLPAPKVRLMVTIREDGRVTRLNMNRQLNGTIFGNCLNAHIDRWRFDPWKGKPVKVARVFILE
jgi:hypothetical protein